jgi:hypothetical protein
MRRRSTWYDTKERSIQVITETHELLRFPSEKKNSISSSEIKTYISQRNFALPKSSQSKISLFLT